MITIKVANYSPNPLPEYKSSLASGMDVMAWLNEPVVLGPLERKLIPSGLHFDIPDGWEIQVRSRSGMALKRGLIVLNGIGTIDADYTGDVGVILCNVSNEVQTVYPGERIAQIVLMKVDKMNLEQVEVIEKQTERGEKGYNSTGSF